MDFDFYYTRDQEEFRKEVRAFIEEHAYKEPIVPADPVRLTPEMYLEARKLACLVGERGWHAPNFPKEYGGGGLDKEHCAILGEEFARIRLQQRWPLRMTGASSIMTAPLMAFATEEQKQRLLRPLLEGKSEYWQCFTEPEAGTDEASMKSTARRDGDVYIINGTKVFVGESPSPIHGEFLYWLAVTDPQAPRHQNIGAFFIPEDLPGIHYTPLDLTAAEVQKWEVICEDVRCPVDCLIGKETDGWQVREATLFAEHGGLGVVAPVKETVITMLIDYCKKTLRNGQPISRDPFIQDVLVSLYTEDQVNRLWGLRNSAMTDGQIPRIPYTETQSILHEKEHSPVLGQAMLDILGPICLTDDPDLQPLIGIIEREVRMADVTHISGTPETQKIMMSRALGLGRSA